MYFNYEIFKVPLYNVRIKIFIIYLSIRAIVRNMVRVGGQKSEGISDCLS